MSADGFVKLPHWLIRESDLTANELLLYIALLSRAGRNGTCFPSLKTLTAESRLSRSTVQRTLKALEDRGLIVTTRRTIGDRRNDSNLYQVAKPGSRPNTDETDDTHPVDNSGGTPANGGHGEHTYGQGEHTLWSQGTHPMVTVTTEEEPEKKNQRRRLQVESSDPTRNGFSFPDDRASEGQVAYLHDLYIHRYNAIPDDTQFRSLTSAAAARYIDDLLADIPRYDAYEGPEYGTPEYNALSPTGQEWADCGMLPDGLGIAS